MFCPECGCDSLRTNDYDGGEYGQSAPYSYKQCEYCGYETERVYYFEDGTTSEDE